jgi:GNAT superfamily N-acetyltransferase
MELKVSPVISSSASEAVALLLQFFAEEGFEGDQHKIAQNLKNMLDDPNCWAGIATSSGVPIGIVTVSALRDIEYGRLAEIGDLYVRPEARGTGVAKAMILAAQDWCRSIDCRAVLVTITAEGAEQHNLFEYYKRLGFEATDRTIAECQLS